nr:hypothetical protein [Nitrosomonas communis]
MEKKLRDTLIEIDQAWQAEGILHLMFQDEARFGCVSDTRRCWCPKPIRPLCKAMITQEYVYAYAAVSIADGEPDTLILPQVNSHCRQLFLDEVASRHPNTGLFWHSMGQDGIIVTPLSCHIICVYLCCHPTHRNSTLLRIFGMSYGRNHSITVCLTAWTRLKSPGSSTMRDMEKDS